MTHLSLICLRRFFLWTATALFLLVACGFGPPTLLDRDIAPEYRWTVGQLRQLQQAQVVPPAISARAVLVYDADADQLLRRANADQPLPPASLAKLVTALLVLEQDRLDERVTIEQADLVGEATMGLQAGEVVTVRDLLWGLLIPSGNDAAMALARHHSGQVHVFVQRMNLRAEEMGLAESRFANPNGFDAPDQTSSARDILTLTRQLWTYPLFRQIVGTANASVAGHFLRNTNELLGALEGANGVKTGTTDAAGQSLVAGVERNGHQIFFVILGSQDRYADLRRLLADYEGYYVRVEPGRPGRLSAFDRVYDAAGRRWLLAAEPVASDLLLPAWERLRLRPYRRLSLPALEPWRVGMEAGILEWRLGDEIVATQRLVLQ